MKLVATSQWPLLLGPIVMVLSMLGLWLAQGNLKPWEVMSAALGAALLILAVGQVQINRVAKRTAAAPPPVLRVRTALPFMVMGILFFVHDRADIVLLGTLRGPHDTGIYAIVARGSAIVAFLAGAVDMILAPRFAAMHRDANHVAMQQLLTSATRRVFFLSLPLAAIFLVAANPILTFFYGVPYSAGATALRILTLGYVTIIFTGSTASIANMTGHERLTLFSVVASVVVNIILNLVLIPIYGMNGSAVATALSLLLYNAMQWFWLRTRLGLHPGVIRL
jgi:O-antigen/teichoic acid export membrane protein